MFNLCNNCNEKDSSMNSLKESQIFFSIPKTKNDLEKKIKKSENSFGSATLLDNSIYNLKEKETKTKIFRKNTNPIPIPKISLPLYEGCKCCKCTYSGYCNKHKTVSCLEDCNKKLCPITGIRGECKCKCDLH